MTTSVKGAALAVFMLVTVGEACAEAGLPQRPLAGIKTTACIKAGETDLAAALPGSDAGDVKILIAYETERRAKSALGAAIADSNKMHGVLRCSFRGKSYFAEYESARNIAFLPVAEDDDDLTRAGRRDADVEESFHAFQVTTRPAIQEGFQKHDALGLYAVVKGMELEAKVATALVTFEMTGDLDAVTHRKSMIFKKGKPMDYGAQIERHVRTALETASNPSTADAAFMTRIFSDAFNLLLFSDDGWYTGRVGTWAESVAPNRERFDLGSFAVLFSALPNGITGHLSAFSPDAAIAAADEDNREFLAKHGQKPKAP